MGFAAPFLGPAIGIATSLMGAKKQKQAQRQANAAMQASEAAAQQRLSPYQQTGQQANQMIQEGLSTGTLGGSFTPPDLASDPGYQFRLAEGQKALEQQQAARGGLYSGAAMKASQRYAQNLANQEYSDAYQRWLQEQQNRYGILSGQQGVGYSAAGGMGNIDIRGGERQGQYEMARREASDRGMAGAIGSVMPMSQSFYPQQVQSRFINY